MFQGILALLLGGFAVAVGGMSGGGSSGSDDDSPAAGGGSGEPEPGAAPALTVPPVSEPEPDPVTPSASEATVTETPDLPASAYDIGWAGLTDEEQLIVELINRARLDPQAEVDRLSEPLASGIGSDPVQALAVTPELSAASRAHSEDMDDRNFFSHTNPSGQSPGDRALAAGHGTGNVGENIGWIGSTREPTGDGIQSRVEDHHRYLWESDGHQRNIMSEFPSEIGVGYDYGSYNGYDGSTFVTEMFGDRGYVYLTGVVIRDGDADDFYDLGEGVGDVRITADDGTNSYGTSTWDAGGYSLALPPGTYRVSFEGGGLAQSYESMVTIGSENVKLDVIEDPLGAVMTSNVELGAVEETTEFVVSDLFLEASPETAFTGDADEIEEEAADTDLALA